MESEGAMCMKLYQPSELTTKDKNVWCSLTTELFNDVNSPRVLTFYGEHFSHFENFDQLLGSDFLYIGKCHCAKKASM